MSLVAPLTMRQFPAASAERVADGRWWFGQAVQGTVAHSSRT
jgi:hypothetical protein